LCVADAIRHVLVTDGDPVGIERAKTALEGLDVEAAATPPKALERMARRQVLGKVVVLPRAHP